MWLAGSSVGVDRQVDAATGTGSYAIEPRQPHTTEAKMQCRSQKRHIGASADRTSWAPPNVCLQKIHKITFPNPAQTLCNQLAHRRSQKQHIVQTRDRQSCASG
jgi:hypothetical protein